MPHMPSIVADDDATKVWMGYMYEYWVIEGNGVYWCGTTLRDFRNKFNCAVRFARRQDGEKVLYLFSKDIKMLCRVVKYKCIEKVEDIHAT